jgi:hypothetical protein
MFWGLGEHAFRLSEAARATVHPKIIQPPTIPAFQGVNVDVSGIAEIIRRGGTKDNKAAASMTGSKMYQAPFIIQM